MYATTRSKPKLKLLEEIPFHELALKYGKLRESGNEEDFKLELANFSKLYVCNNFGSVFSQMLTKIAELPLEKNESGKYSGRKLFSEFRKSNFMSGILLVCIHPTRSIFVPEQTGIEGRNYCSLVPLIMCAFKKYRNIQYSEWDREEISIIVAPNLAAAMLAEIPSLSKEEVLEARKIALTPLTGFKAGVMSNPATTYKLYLRKESGMSHLPDLAKIMMCQTWCSHPINRNNWMILDPTDWDNMPEELVSTSVFTKEAKASDSSYAFSNW